MMKKISLCFIILFVHFFKVAAQPLISNLQFSKDSLLIQSFETNDQQLSISNPSLSLISFVLNDKTYFSNEVIKFQHKLSIQLENFTKTDFGISAVIRFKNIGIDTLQLENVVPFGIDKDRVYITGKDKHALSRTHLFVPDKIPVNVIVPDNSWDLGFCVLPNQYENKQVAGLVRRNRTSIKNGSRTRFETKLFPGGSVEYNLYIE